MKIALLFMYLSVGMTLGASIDGSAIATVQGAAPTVLEPVYAGATLAEVDAEERYQRGHDALIGGDKEQAIGEFIQSCEGGNAKSCFNVGALHEEKIAGDPRNDANHNIAITYMGRACKSGFQRACVAEANYYRLAKYGMQDIQRSIIQLTKACELNESTGCEALAELYLSGSGVPVNVARAAKLFKQSCDAGGRGLSCFNYGLLRSNGQGVAADLQDAIRYYRLGCRRGSDDACTNLAIYYLRSDASLPELGIGAGLLRNTCKNGGLAACSNMGALLREGKITDASNSEAAGFFRKACDGGYGAGCRSLGNMAEEGIKVAGPKRAALKYYVKGCILEYASSCYNVGLVYWTGFHAPKRVRASLAWFGKGCKMGSASSCAGASLAALSLNKGDPNGGEEMAKRWFDEAKRIDPDNGLVKSLEEWRSKQK